MELDWIKWYHFLFAFLFSFLLTNVLVALIQNSYTMVVADSAIWDVRLKMELIVEAVELKILGARLSRKVPPLIRSEQNLDPNNSDPEQLKEIYLVKEIDNLAIDTDNETHDMCILYGTAEHSLGHLKKEAITSTAFGGKLQLRKNESVDLLNVASGYMKTTLDHFSRHSILKDTEFEREIKAKKYEERLAMVTDDENLMMGSIADSRKLLRQAETNYYAGKISWEQKEHIDTDMQKSMEGVLEHLDRLGK